MNTGTKRKDSSRIVLNKGEDQQKNGSYRYRWTDNGKRCVVYAPTLKELREKEAEINRSKQDGIRTDVSSITVNHLFELWRDLKRGIKDNTFQNYIYMYNLHVRDTFGRNRIVMVRKTDIRQFYNHFLDAKIMKISTIETINNMLGPMFQIAVDDGMIRNNPTTGVYKDLKKALNVERKKRKALTQAEQDVFINYLRTEPKYRQWYPYFAILLGTGMRIGECMGLRWCDIDINNGIIDINHTLVYYMHAGANDSYFSVNSPKTAASRRMIPMFGFVKDAFVELLEKKEG